MNQESRLNVKWAILNGYFSSLALSFSIKFCKIFQRLGVIFFLKKTLVLWQNHFPPFPKNSPIRKNQFYGPSTWKKVLVKRSVHLEVLAGASLLIRPVVAPAEAGHGDPQAQSRVLLQWG